MTPEEKLAELRRVLRDEILVGASPVDRAENLNFDYLRGREDCKRWINEWAHAMLRIIGS